MGRSALFITIHIGLLTAAILLALPFLLDPAATGRLALELRTLLAAGSLLTLLLAIRPWLPAFGRRPWLYLALVCLPASALTGWYFLAFLPSRAADTLQGEQLASALLTDSTVNAIVVVGFSYPIFTPTVRLTNNSLYTREVDVFLRILDANNEAALFRAVRETLPDTRLSVEASVRGMLSENPEYRFIPIAIPPGSSVEGRVAFIISDLYDGTTFQEALGRSYPAEFQIRDPDSGELLASFPLTRTT